MTFLLNIGLLVTGIQESLQAAEISLATTEIRAAEPKGKASPLLSELSDLRYNNLSAVKGIDLVANNVAAKAFIVSALPFSTLMPAIQ